MSVDTRRSAAPARTATCTIGSASPSRLKLALTWLTIATALTFFTFTVVATAASSKPDYAGALEKLTRDNPPSDDSAIVIRNGNKKEICTVNESQLGLLQSRYAVGRMTVTIDGTPTDVVTVEDANPHELHVLLGDMRCTLVKEKRVFYLPFDPVSTE